MKSSAFSRGFESTRDRFHTACRRSKITRRPCRFLMLAPRCRSLKYLVPLTGGVYVQSRGIPC